MAVQNAIKVDILGRFHLAVGEDVVAPTAKGHVQSLLAYLLLHPTDPVARQKLAFIFWPDSTEKQARTNLRKLIFRLRQELPLVEKCLTITPVALGWSDQVAVTSDVMRFQTALLTARAAHTPDDRLVALEHAVTLYQGELLPDCYDEWILPERQRLQAAYEEALGQLVVMLERQRDYQAAIRYARRLLRQDPLLEAIHRRLMRLHALNGDPAAALRAYHNCTTVLQRELGVEPGDETHALYRQLLRRDDQAPAALQPTPLIGRHNSWRRLRDLWQPHHRKGPHLALIRGEAGIGKTRLADEMLLWADRQGIDTASARCYPGGGNLSFAPVVEWLRAEPLQQALAALADVWQVELVRLLPELASEFPHLPTPGPIAERWQQQRLHQALVQAVSAGRPRLLLLDNLQWCDADTMAVLDGLLHSRLSAPLLILATLRAGELASDQRLQPTVRRWWSERVLTDIELGPLNADDTAALAATILGAPLAEEEAARLYAETEGNPLFVLETLRSGLAAGDAMPRGIHGVLENRLSQLSPTAQELAQTAAVIGRSFTGTALLAASEAGENAAIMGLDELWQRKIIRAVAEDHYDFTHGKIRQVAYADLSPVRRRHLHGRVAGALEALHGGNLDLVCGQIAEHYDAAGQPEQAIAWYQCAAVTAQRLYAIEEGIAHLQRALALLDEGNPALAAQLHQQLGDLLTVAARHVEAQQAYRTALVYSQDPLQRLEVRTGLIPICNRMNRADLAEEHYRQGETEAEIASKMDTLDWRRRWIDLQLAWLDCLYFNGRVTEMAGMISEIGDALDAHATLPQKQRFLHSRIMLNLRRERFRPSSSTVALSREALAVSLQSEDGVAYARLGLGFGLLWAHHKEEDLAEAVEQLRSSLANFDRTGDKGGQNQCLCYLTVAHRFLGLVEEARSYAQRHQPLAEAEGYSFYVGAVHGNLGWLAYRDGDWDMALQHIDQANEAWQRAVPYPFHCLSRFPELAIAAARGNLPVALPAAEDLLAPLQYRLQDDLTLTLEQALEAAADQRETALARLKNAIALATDYGYL